MSRSPSRTPPRTARPASRTASGPAAEPAPIDLRTRAVAELLGTFVLVLGGVGTALFAAAFPDTGVGFLGVSLAFGLAVVAAALAFGHLSGAHLNPAVTLGLAVAGRTPWRDVPAYAGAQVVGGLLATGVLAAIAAGGPAGRFDELHAAGFAANGFGAHSPGGYGLLSVVLVELVLTAVLVLVVLGATDERASAALAPLAIGAALTLIHLVGIPVSNTSVNPARSIAAAVWGGAPALAQLWVFLLVPLAGGAVAGLLHRRLLVAGRRPTG